MSIGISTPTWAQEQANWEPGDQTIFHNWEADDSSYQNIFHTRHSLHSIQFLLYSKLGARGGGWEYGRNNSWVGMRGGEVLRLMSWTLLRCETTKLLPLCLWMTFRLTVSDAGPLPTKWNLGSTSFYKFCQQGKHFFVKMCFNQDNRDFLNWCWISSPSLLFWQLFSDGRRLHGREASL